MAKIKLIQAREILDSRGNPTLETKVELEEGASGLASVPSGASVGKYEAVELRDNDPQRFHGLGVLRAVTNVNQIIAPQLIGLESTKQAEVDQILIKLDGTANKSKLGANAILSVSQGVCEAAAASQKIATYLHVAHLYRSSDKLAYGSPTNLHLPIPTFNLINGGKHGAGNLDFQEFHIIPSSQKTYSENLRLAEEIYQSLKQVLIQHGAIHSVGDEGGFAPNLFTNLDALEILTKAIEAAHYRFQQDVFLGLDIAAQYFYQNGKYKIRDQAMAMTADELIAYYQQLNQQYPLLTLEDPLAEDDWSSWQKVSQLLSGTLVVGDDLLATNKQRVNEAIKKRACGAILIKPNQIGTISETMEVVKIARQAGWKIIVSHRSGETTDDFIADFSVGVNADYTKFGAPARGERVSKYNRLLEIEKQLNLG